jgi:hypothetical protein
MLPTSLTEDALWPEHFNYKKMFNNKNKKPDIPCSAEVQGCSRQRGLRLAAEAADTAQNT